jgi:hypothetical protein
MRELLVKGAMDEGMLPIFLKTWVDKTSPLCMFTQAQIRAWSAPHLKSGCWYLDCAKGLCPEEEEDLKKFVDNASSTIDLTAAEDSPEDEPEQLNDKEKKKKKNKKNERARKKKERQEEKATEKAGQKSKKSSTPEVSILESSSALPSAVARKRDASYAGLSAQRLQAGSSPAFKSHVIEGIAVDEFIYPGSLLTMDAHFSEHNEFPQGWNDLMSFLEKVSLC